MARIFLSPLIVDIRAKQADTVFSKWRGINYIRSRVIPANPKTSNQTAVRNALAHLVSLWQAVTSLVRNNRNAYASGKALSGFNSFIGDNIVKERDGDLLDITKDLGYSKLTSLSASGGSSSGQIDVTFAPAAATDDRVYLLVRKAHTGEWADHAAVSSGTTYTFSGLESGATYEIYGFRYKYPDPTGADVSDDLSTTATAT